MKKKLNLWLLSLAAAVLLMSNVYVGRAEEEPFEIVWQKDIGLGIEYYPLDKYLIPYNKYVVSDKIGNFVIYRDSTNSLTVLDLNSGEIINRLIPANNIEIADFILLKNNTRLLLWDKSSNIYIYNTVNWELERIIYSQFGSPTAISDDLSTIVFNNMKFYDFNTMNFLFELDIEKYLGHTGFHRISFSKDLKRMFVITLLAEQPPHGELINLGTFLQIYDLLTKKQIFKIHYDDWLYAINNDDISKIYIINKDSLEIFDIGNNNKLEKIPYPMDAQPPFKLSKNNKYMYSGGESWIILIKSLIHGYNNYYYSDGGTFADVGEDYIIGWIAGNKNNDYKNYLVKININDQNLVPVQDISNETEILYPNPTNSIVHISNVHLQNINEIKVIDEKGCDFSEICTVGLLPDGIDLNLQKLNTGVYFIRVGNSEFSKTYKVIKC